MVDMSDPASAAVDIEQLADMLRERRSKERKSLRDVAAETGVPFSTLARVESGRLPDLNTFRNIVAWLGVSPARFFPTTKAREEATPDIIAHILREDPALTEQAQEQLSLVMSQMYAALTIQARPVQVHLRADRNFTPEAGNLLATLLGQMQDKLSGEGHD